MIKVQSVTQYTTPREDCLASATLVGRLLTIYIRCQNGWGDVLPGRRACQTSTHVLDVQISRFVQIVWCLSVQRKDNTFNLFMLKNCILFWIASIRETETWIPYFMYKICYTFRFLFLLTFTHFRYRLQEYICAKKKPQLCEVHLL